MSIEKISKNSKGGARPGAGRKKGAPNIRTKATQKAVEGSGITPLEYMLQVMRAVDTEPKDRLSAAVAAAPYVHAKLSSVEMKATVTTKTLSEEISALNAITNAASD